MRISTNSIYEAGTRQLNSLQAQLARSQEQLASNKRMLSAADDPIASARALVVTQSQSINTQFTTNRQNARSSLSQLEVALNSAQALVLDVQDIVVKAGNGANSLSDRASYATELQGKLDDLLAVANSADGAGGYLFSGFKSNVVPYSKSATGAVYNGDQGQVQLQVASSRQVQINATGPAVFDDIATGNGTFVTGAASGNTGSGLVSPGLVADPSLVTGHDYALKFAVAGTPAVTTYTIQDLTTNTSVPPPPTPPAVATPTVYQSGAPITFDGVTFSVAGAPANGDSFTVAPSQKQSLFTTVTNLIAALRAPASAGNTAYSNALAGASVNLSAGLDKVLSARSSVGTSLKELDYLDDAGAGAGLQYAATLSDLQDLDQVKAISDFTQQKNALDAAQITFKAISSLSLFNLL